MILTKKSMLRLILMLVICNVTLAQSVNNFILNGDLKTDDVKSLTVASGFISGDFSKYTLKNNENHVVDNTFKIEGEMDYPHAFRFITNTGEITGLFFVDNSNQSVHINEFGLNITPLIEGSKTNDEYVNNYIPLIQNLLVEDERLKNSWNDSISETTKTEIRDGRKSIRTEKNIILLQYLKKHPNSYVGMWLFAENFSIYGYETIYEEMYSAMSNELKSTYCGQGINQKLKVTRVSAVNGALPDAMLSEYNSSEKKIKFDDFESKYLMVDFWASYCGPCIKQFPYLLEVYNNTPRDVFDIVAISIDDDETKNDWISILEEQHLPWMQYLDEKGFSKQLFINSVPANFLLDGSGQIVLRDFTVDELQEFLEL